MRVRNAPPADRRGLFRWYLAEPIVGWEAASWCRIRWWVSVSSLVGGLLFPSDLPGQTYRPVGKTGDAPARVARGNVGGRQENRFDRIEVEVVFPPPRPPQDGARWAQLLRECGFDRAVLRKATPVDEIQATSGVVAGQRTLKITAGLHQGRLMLPGAAFHLNEAAEIRDWVAWQRMARPSGEGLDPPAMSEEVAFGLNSIELVRLEQQLAKEVTESTLRMSQQDRWNTLQATSPILLIPSRDSAMALVKSESVPMELNGLSVGTALAVMGRPMGLVLVPGKSSSGQFQLEFQNSDRPKEFWPIGWPTERPLIDLTPAMFRQTVLDLRGQTVAEAMQLIASQAGVPILLDRNSLLKNGVDVDQRTTSVTIDNGTLHKAMKTVATECRADLNIECRLDEAGRAFFWLSIPPRPTFSR